MTFTQFPPQKNPTFRHRFWRAGFLDPNPLSFFCFLVGGQQKKQTNNPLGPTSDLNGWLSIG